MRKRLSNLEAVVSALKPYLNEYLEENGVDTSKNFLCLNPKHKDSDPSMTTKQVPDNAYCFGCKYTLDIFSAAHHLEKKPIKGPQWIDDNVLYLAEKYDVHVELEDLTPEEIYEYRTYEAYRYAAKLVTDLEFGDYTKADKEFSRRGWEKEKCANWGMGTVNYGEYKAAMKAAGYEPSFLEGVDLDRSNIFDNHNLIFTVYDDKGRPVGFSSRNLNYTKDKKHGTKYNNTKTTGLECAIFKKGERLYGFDIAKEIQGPLYIFEGQADVIAARHSGIMNSCCVLGTAFSDHHVNLLKRYGLFKLIFVFDADQAGEMAIQKVLDEKFSETRDFRIQLIQLPAGQDPDDLLREQGIEEFLRMKKWSAFEWRMMKFMDRAEEDKDPREVADKMIRIIISEDSRIRQEEMAKQVAKMTGYDISTIMSEVKRLRDEKEAETQVKKLAALESMVWEARKNPENISNVVDEAKILIDSIDKEAETSDKIASSVLSFVRNQKEMDEAKGTDFEGFHLRPNGLGNLGARLNGDWRRQGLLFVAASEQGLKCQHHESKILLADGTYKTIEEVVREKSPTVIGMNAHKKLVPLDVSNWVDSGVIDCCEIKTKAGISTKPTENHPYYTLDGWKKVKELKVGDKIAIAAKYNCFNQLRSPISEEKAMLLAAFLADGSITESVGFSNTDPELIDWFKNTVGNNWEGTTFRDYPVGNMIYVADKGQKENRVKEWLKGYGLMGKNSHTKLIPDEIFKCNPLRIAKFIGMFWACDGCVSLEGEPENHFRIVMALCNYEMTKQIRSLLLRLEIKTSIKSYNVYLNGKTFRKHEVYIEDMENARKFYNKIRIPLQYKQDKLKSIIELNKKTLGAYNGNFPKEIWSYINKQLKKKGWTFNQLMILLGEDRNRIIFNSYDNTFKISPAWRPKANSRTKTGEEWLGVTPKKLRLIGYVLNDQFLIDLAEGDIIFDEITEITPIGKHQCYDLEVPGAQNFIAEDTIVHNTTLCCQLAYEIASDERNNAICIYHSIDDSAKFILYKWVACAAEGVSLELNHVSHPGYWSKQEGHGWIPEQRNKAYSEVLNLIKDEKLILKDASSGCTLAYAESLAKSYRQRFPEKNVVLILDNFHKFTDFGDMRGHERTKRLSNYLKNMTTAHDVTVISTAEYRKLASGEMGGNTALAESRSLQYDATVILHLYNEMHQKPEEECVLVHEHEDIFGNKKLLPRLQCKFGKNKVSGYIGHEYLNAYPANATLKGVPFDIAKQDCQTRRAFLKEEDNTDWKKKNNK